MHSLDNFSVFLQRSLFPALEQEAGPLSVLDRQFMVTLAMSEFERFKAEFAWLGNGRPPAERLWLMHAFAAKSVYQFPTTSALIHALRAQPTLRRLCGFAHSGEVPSEATFSRAFEQFSANKLAQRVHERIVLTHVNVNVQAEVGNRWETSGKLPTIAERVETPSQDRLTFV